MAQSALDTYYYLFFRGNRLYSQLAKQLGESPQTLFLLCFLLQEAQGLSQSDICASLSAPKQTMSRVLKDLEARGDVRESPSERDGREKLFSLTDAGQAHARTLTDRLGEIEDACMGATRGSLDAVNGLNGRYLDALEQYLQNLRKGH